MVIISGAVSPRWAILCLAFSLVGCHQSADSYTVAAGDTGIAIARQRHVDFARLRELNPGVNWKRLRPGQRIWVPRAAAATAQVLDATTAESRLPPQVPWWKRLLNRVHPRTHSHAPATAILIRYSGPPLHTINPQVVSSSGVIILDDLPLLDNELIHVNRCDDAEAVRGVRPLVIQGHASSRYQVQVSSAQASTLARAWDAADAKEEHLPVVFCRK